jgi:hypothetical protein
MIDFTDTKTTKVLRKVYLIVDYSQKVQTAIPWIIASEKVHEGRKDKFSEEELKAKIKENLEKDHP